MSSRFSAAIVAGVLSALSFSAPANAAGCHGAHLQPSSHNMGTIQHSVLCLLNQERAKHGLKALHSSKRLRGAAKHHSRAMVSDHFFDHTSPSGSTMVSRISSVGYRFRMAGENIGWGSGYLATPAAMVRGWMHSQGHRENILRRGFHEIGIGVVTGTPEGSGGATYTTDFGAKR